MQSLHEHSLSCPYCGEHITALIDTSAGDQAYIEDCQVCCQPINFEVTIDADGTPTVETFSDND